MLIVLLIGIVNNDKERIRQSFLDAYANYTIIKVMCYSFKVGKAMK